VSDPEVLAFDLYGQHSSTPSGSRHTLTRLTNPVTAVGLARLCVSVSVSSSTRFTDHCYGALSGLPLGSLLGHSRMHWR